jgi:hypothetical protein
MANTRNHWIRLEFILNFPAKALSFVHCVPLYFREFILRLLEHYDLRQELYQSWQSISIDLHTAGTPVNTTTETRTPQQM